MADNKDTSTGKSMDIAKPGKSAPDTTSRPVIVTHQPIVQDPMVKSSENTKDTKPSDTQTSSHNKNIQPLTSSEKENDDTISEPDKSEEPTDKDSKTKEQKEADKEAAVVDAIAQQSAMGEYKKRTGKLSHEEIEKQKHITQLIESKKYFVPIGQLARRRNKRALVILLVLVFVIGGLYIAIDAGLIDIGIDLPFSIIK